MGFRWAKLQRGLHAFLPAFVNFSSRPFTSAADSDWALVANAPVFVFFRSLLCLVVVRLTLNCSVCIKIQPSYPAASRSPLVSEESWISTSLMHEHIEQSKHHKIKDWGVFWSLFSSFSFNYMFFWINSWFLNQWLNCQENSWLIRNTYRYGSIFCSCSDKMLN